MRIKLLQGGKDVSHIQEVSHMQDLILTLLLIAVILKR